MLNLQHCLVLWCFARKRNEKPQCLVCTMGMACPSMLAWPTSCSPVPTAIHQTWSLLVRTLKGIPLRWFLSSWSPVYLRTAPPGMSPEQLTSQLPGVKHICGCWGCRVGSGLFCQECAYMEQMSPKGFSEEQESGGWCCAFPSSQVKWARSKLSPFLDVLKKHSSFEEYSYN